MYLNSLADRSFSDLTQYPVMPWVVADYSSSTLDLINPSTYRDLSKPVGALNEKRLDGYKQRYKDMPSGPGFPPPFLYGTHYSTPGYVLYYLLRQQPEWMLCLQAGKFDVSDRLFYSLEQTYKGVNENPSDLKELIPEFYSGNGDFLNNTSNIKLGIRHDGNEVHHVKLPPWATSPDDFILKHRSALESEYVSDRIHLWIDLIFGYKQQGKNAIEADNLFYYLTYEGAVDLDKISSKIERQSFEIQIKEFGQTPRQLFTTAHPCRRKEGEITWKGVEHYKGRERGRRSTVTKPIMPLFDIDIKNTSKTTANFSGTSGPSIDFKTNYTTSMDSTITTTATTTNTADLKINNNNISSQVKIKDNFISVCSKKWKNVHTLPLHHRDITGIHILNDGDSLVSISSDSYLKVYSLSTSSTRRNVNMSSLALSCRYR